MASPKRTLYEVVGVAPDAPAEEIAGACEARRAQLEAQGSPDASAIALVRHAREVLTHPERRAAYDARIAAAAASEIPVSSDGDKPQAVPVIEAPAGEPPRRTPWGLLAVIGAAALIVVLFVARMMTNPVPTGPVAEAPKQPAAAPPAAPLAPAQILAAATPSIARLQSVDLSGSVQSLGLGVVVEPGIAVTTCHAIPANAQIVAMFGADKAAATLVITDEVLDLCKLSLAGVDAPVLALAPKDARPGDEVYVVSPAAPGSYALAEAKVQATVKTPAGDALQLSSAGTNGAPVLDARGKLAALATEGHAIPAAWIAQAKSRTR
ncbi:MAG TPA: serine protease [Usitatibacter sp.]|jgi:hypothetical protein|nr:serine protease [Usitatibacter sp.]